MTNLGNFFGERNLLGNLKYFEFFQFWSATFVKYVSNILKKRIFFSVEYGYLTNIPVFQHVEWGITF